MDDRKTEEILDLMGIMVSSYPSQAGQDSTASIRGYMMAIEGCSHRAICQVLRNIITGKQTGFNNRFAPSSGELGGMCRAADETFALIEAPRRKPEHGILKLNFGGRDIDTSSMPLKEVEEIMRTGGRSHQSQIGNASRSAMSRIQAFDSAEEDDHDMGALDQKRAGG